MALGICPVPLVNVQFRQDSFRYAGDDRLKHYAGYPNDLKDGMHDGIQGRAGLRLLGKHPWLGLLNEEICVSQKALNEIYAKVEVTFLEVRAHLKEGG